MYCRSKYTSTWFYCAYIPSTGKRLVIAVTVPRCSRFPEIVVDCKIDVATGGLIRQTQPNYPLTMKTSGGSWWNWPGGLRIFISGWTYGIVALAVFITSVSIHSSSPNLIKLVLFSCPYSYIENIHFSWNQTLKRKHEHKKKLNRFHQKHDA